MAASTPTETARQRSGTRSLVEPVGPSAEPFRMLRVALELLPDSSGKNVVLFTSANQGEGKSTVAANFALVSATQNRRVLLIDGDLRSPAQHLIFGIPRAPGLTEIVFSRLDLHAVVQPIRALPGLHVLTVGMPAPQAGWDITASNAVRDLLAAAGREYDIVAIDSPPVLVSADAAHLAAHPGVNVVFVADKNQGTRQVARAVAKLELVGANLLGFVLNREGSLSEYGYGS